MPSTATTRTVTGLTNGTAHTFRVAATNALGTGAFSTASAAVTPGAGDPLFASVSLMLNFEGSTVVDYSPYNHSMTLTNATLSSAQAKFGSKSLSTVAGGGVTSAAITPLSSAFAFGLGDFCIEGWYYQTSYGGEASVWCLGSWGEAPDFMLYAISNYIQVTFPANEPLNCGSLTLNTWTHVAIARTAGLFSIYNNGVRVAQKTVTAYSGGNFSASRTFYVGTPGGPGFLSGFAGLIDEFRITKNNRGYTGATITVPTAAFPTS